MVRGISKISSLVISLLLCLVPSHILADIAGYAYDDLGRLVRVINGDERALYQYDEVGNLLAISKEDSTIQELPPVITGIDPDIFIVGSTHYVTFTGQNLLTANSVTSDNPNVTVKNVVAIDTRILAVFNVAENASSGQAIITVTTAYGSADISISIHRVELAPESLSVFPTNIATISAGLTPPASENLHIAVINKNSDIISAQAFVDIPSGGNGTITVKGVKEGLGVIKAGSAETSIFVVNDAIHAKPVSVSIGSIPGEAIASASPVSVAFGALNNCIAVSSKNVSVAWAASVNSFTGKPVSTGWQTLQSGITVARPVSVQIQSN